MWSPTSRVDPSSGTRPRNALPRYEGPKSLCESPCRLFVLNVQIGDKVTPSITDIAFGGEGVARLEDFVIFVPFVALGEEVEAEVTEVKKRFARAKLLRIIHPSPERVQPPCPYFG